ncbi:MAG: hypothetical protein JWM91_5399 [Rhodospirillales bacterium]|nr:hypothetical protein [Rhodospirillales bacterium]
MTVAVKRCRLGGIAVAALLGGGITTSAFAQATASLVSAVLPSSRSVQIGQTATAFATIINAGTATGTACSIAPSTTIPANFAYQTTSSATNAPTGSANTPIDIAPGASQSFIISLTPTAAIPPISVGFSFSCTNAASAPLTTGVNDLLLSGSATPVPGMVAMSATASNDGIVHIPGNTGTGAFAIASVNVGATGDLTVSADTGSAGIPLALTLCQTMPSTGACLQSPSASVHPTINAGATPTFSVFAVGSGAIPFAPATSRVFVRFTDSGGAVRGSTSVAVVTDNPTTTGSASILLPGPSVLGTALTQADVGKIISQVVQEAKARGKPATIAIVDRLGAVLAVYAMNGAPATFQIESNPNGPNATQLIDGLSGVANLGAVPLVPATLEAIAKAVTGAYLSTSHGNAFTTRTASQIVQDHFNPGTMGAPSGPLFGVQFSSLPCSDLNVRYSPTADLSSTTRGPHRSPLGLAGDPGGFPLYKNGELVGGIGVKAEGPYRVDEYIYDNDHSTDEIEALAGTIGFDTPAAIRADTINAGGITLRYSDATPSDFVTTPASAPAYASLPVGTGSLLSVSGYYSSADGLRAGSPYGSSASGIVQDFSGTVSTSVPPYLLVDGASMVRYPAVAGAGPSAMTQAEALQVLKSAYASAIQTRAQIRNPPGSVLAVTISVVDVYGTPVGVATLPDAPVFGIDVSLQKARTAVFMSSANGDAALKSTPANPAGGPSVGKFSDAAAAFFGRPVFSGGYAWGARAIGNISRDSYPDGIDTTPNGPLSLAKNLSTPFSVGLQLDLILGNIKSHLVSVVTGDPTADTPPFCTALPAPPGSPTGKPVMANGEQIFPGGFPIYRNGVLIGGVGISGDGVDQDDMTAFLGIYNAGQALGTGLGEAPPAIRASTLYGNGAAPHYVNCPFAPYVGSNSQNLCAGK